jgi:hypothetical protein
MNVGLYDVDSKIPNLAIMKISAYHKNLGHSVERFSPLSIDSYDKIYASKIFNYSSSDNLFPDRMEIGGSAWDLKKNLPPEIEIVNPDYTFYNYPHSIGFTMRGCRFNCKFCIVPQKEGKPKPFNTIDEIWTNRNSDFIVLLDNDFFGNPLWEDRINEIRKYDLKVSFSQGLNIRIITDEQAGALASVKFRNIKNISKSVCFAWDRFKDERLIDAGIERVIKAGIKPYQMMFFILIGFDTTPEQDLYRVNKLANLGCDPFVMPYNKKDFYQRNFARWVNHKATFRSVKWQDYSG